PIQWCIAQGEKISGMTTMLMDEGLDTGDILLKTEVEITSDMTGGQLHDEYCRIGSALLLETLEKLENGEITPRKQDNSISSYAPMLTHENTKIDCGSDADEIVNLVRAMDPYPGAYTRINGKKLKVFACRALNIKSDKSGVVLSTQDGLTVGCKNSAVLITQLQLEGKKRMGAAEFLRGYKINKGEQLT
ncbi:MAG: methionyl-tRNA formyltransferase, partial [Clostridiaceae bacterium]|nr:methionyl-tRNA formyltransferase [Clostridiaceae bacterium]